MKFDIGGLFENLSRKFKFHLKSDKNSGTLHEDQYTCFIISLSFLFRMKNVSDKSCRGNQNTRFMFNNFSFRESCLLRDNVEKYFRAGKANMAHAHCMLDT
jgi:hypothetical protein